MINYRTPKHRIADFVFICRNLKLEFQTFIFFFFVEFDYKRNMYVGKISKIFKAHKRKEES